MSLKSKYEKIVNKYLEKFMVKHGFDKDSEVWWVADMVGTTLFINDYFFNFHDILYDLDNEIDNGVLIEWYDYVLEKQDFKINYNSYLMGAR